MLYKIKQGNHYVSNWSLSLGGFHTGITYMERTVKFDASALYMITDPPGQIDKCHNDINKLFGFSYGLHQTNSFRFGWNCTDNKQINIYAYWYIDGVRGSKKLDVYVPGESFKAYIRYNRGTGRITFGIEDETGFITTFDELDYTAAPCMGYYLLPYFGGNCTAPHDMLIEIQ